MRVCSILFVVLGVALGACSETDTRGTDGGSPSSEIPSGVGQGSSTLGTSTAAPNHGETSTDIRLEPSSQTSSTSAPRASTDDSTGAPETTTAPGSSTFGKTSAPGVLDSTSHEGSTSTAPQPSSTASTTSASPIQLPGELTSLFPLPGALGLCPDPALRLGFNGKPSLGSSGKLRVFDATADNAPLVTIDMAQTTVSDTIGGQTFQLAQVAYVDGNDVVFTLPAKGLGFGKTFYVTIEPGTVRGPAGDFVIAAETTWRFSTLETAPSNVTDLRVAHGSTGHFCSLQTALDAADDGTTITVAAGVYYGVLYTKDKQGVTLRGDERDTTILRGLNNNNLNPSTRGRALFGTEGMSDFTLENLTIENLTPQGGSQAEALVLLSCDRCLVRNTSIRSLQDTILWSGRVYADHCYIEGNVDYIWGTGAVYFNACEIKTVGRKGYNVQSRNGANGHGYVFVDSKLTAEPGITGDVLARIDVSEYPNSEVAYIDCELGPHISPEGWLVTGGNAPSTLRFLEYQSRDPDGNLLDTSSRLSGSRQLTGSEAAELRDPQVVLDGWNPSEL